MKKIVSILLLIFFNQLVNASECYHYHTSSTTKLFIKNKQLYFQYTERDQNGFTYVTQQNKLLKGVDPKTYKFFGEDEEVFVFSDKAGVYSLNKNEQFDEKDAKFYKILNVNEGIKQINGRLFLLNRKWTYINIWQGKITKIVISELPVNIVNIKFWTNGFYVKDDKNVYAIKLDLNEAKKYQFSIIPGLVPNEIKHYPCSPDLNEDYLADKNTMFYISNSGDFVDITPQLLALGFRGEYNRMKLIDDTIPLWQMGVFMLKKRYGASSTRKNPLTGEEIEVEYAYSSAKLLKPSAGQSSYVIFRNNIYPIWDDNFSLPAQVNISPNQLLAVDGNLFKSNRFYYIGNTNNYKLTNTNITAKAKFYQSVSSYGRSLPKALVDDNFIYFIGDQFDFQSGNQEALTSKMVKQLGAFYLFNHSLYDGNKSHPLKADEETLSYLGSFVEVINGCAGDMSGSQPVEVLYHHFFKDNTSVYYFNDSENKWQMIQTANPADYLINDFDGLQALYKIKDVKGVVKKIPDNSVNYVAIMISGLALVILSVLLYKKFKK